MTTEPDETNLPTWAEVEAIAREAADRHARTFEGRGPGTRHADYKAGVRDGFAAGVLWMKGRLAPRAAWPRADGAAARKVGGSRR